MDNVTKLDAIELSVLNLKMEGKTHAEVALKLGVPRIVVSQICVKLIKMLRRNQ